MGKAKRLQFKTDGTKTFEGMMDTSDALIAGVLNQTIDPLLAQTAIAGLRVKLHTVNTALRARKAGMEFGKSLPSAKAPKPNAVSESGEGK